MSCQSENNKQKPSQITKEYWVFAVSNRKYPAPTSNCGKWMIFATKGKILDSIWASVKNATEAGLLGNSSKCSTSKQNPNARNKSMGVICIYTYDSNDTNDLKRIAEQLFRIDGVEKLVYKEDRATATGRYSNKGDKKISRWFVYKTNFKDILSV